LTATPAYRATLSVSSTSLSADNYNPQTSVNGLNAASLQSALTTELTVCRQWQLIWIEALALNNAPTLPYRRASILQSQFRL
jgi:hypothetical protein